LLLLTIKVKLVTQGDLKLADFDSLVYDQIEFRLN